MDRRPNSDLGLLYAMLRQCGIMSIDLADLEAYEVVEISAANGDAYDCYLDHGPGLKLRFHHACVADLDNLADARTQIEAAARTPVTLVRHPDRAIPGRWIPVPLDPDAGGEGRTGEVRTEAGAMSAR